MMYIYAIACIKDRDNLLGLRLLDFDTRQVLNVPTNKIKSAILAGKLDIQNAGLQNNKLIGTNGSLDRYPVVDTQGRLIGKGSPLIVINKFCDIGYQVSDFKGTIKTLHNCDVAKYVEKFGIANGKLVIKDKKCFISAISGTYIMNEDMQLMNYGLLDKNDIVILKALFNQKLHEAVLRKDAKTVEKIIKEEYQGEYYEASSLDMDLVYKEYKKELKSDLSWAM